MKTLPELMARRSEILTEARELLGELEGNVTDKRADQLGKQHDALMAELDTIDPQIERFGKQARAESFGNALAAGGGGGDSDERAARRPILDGAADFDEQRGGDWFDRRSISTGWVNDKGEAVRVLGPRDTFSKRSQDGIALGDTLRALVTGPRSEAERRALSEGTDSAGGYTVPTPLASEFIDKLRRKSVAIRAGARTVPMESETLAIARLETDPTVAWRAEAGDIAEGDPTFGRVLFTAKSLAGIVKVSRELMADSVNIGSILEMALTKAMALEIDRASIFGDGSSNSPTGVINVSGINEVEMGTNGAALVDFDPLIDTIYEMQLDNAEFPTAGIMHPRTGAALAKLKDGNDMYLSPPKFLEPVPLLSTTAAPIDETQGTAENASSIVFGDYTQLMIGMRETITIMFLKELYAKTGQIALVVHARADMQLAHKASFSRLKGIIPAS